MKWVLIYDDEGVVWRGFTNPDKWCIDGNCGECSCCIMDAAREAEMSVYTIDVDHSWIDTGMGLRLHQLSAVTHSIFYKLEYQDRLTVIREWAYAPASGMFYRPEEVHNFTRVGVCT